MANGRPGLGEGGFDNHSEAARVAASGGFLPSLGARILDSGFSTVSGVACGLEPPGRQLTEMAHGGTS